MDKRIVATPSAPEAIGPYSQAVERDGRVYLSGQIALDPATGKIVPGGVAEQTRRVMENIAAVLSAAGATFEHVVKTTIYLASMDDFKTVNGVYAEYFPSNPPARATVAVASLPLGALVEIEAVAHL